MSFESRRWSRLYNHFLIWAIVPKTRLLEVIGTENRTVVSYVSGKNTTPRSFIFHCKWAAEISLYVGVKWVPQLSSIIAWYHMIQGDDYLSDRFAEALRVRISVREARLCDGVRNYENFIPDSSNLVWRVYFDLFTLFLDCWKIHHFASMSPSSKSNGRRLPGTDAGKCIESVGETKPGVLLGFVVLVAGGEVLKALDQTRLQSSNANVARTLLLENPRQGRLPSKEYIGGCWWFCDWCVIGPLFWGQRDTRTFVVGHGQAWRVVKVVSYVLCWK